MTENATFVGTLDENPGVKHDFVLKPIAEKGILSCNNHSSALNTSGALQQLSELLSMHTEGETMGNLKGNTPTIPINDLRGDEAARFSREERLIRCQLSALCRLIDLNGWTNSIYNQISAKCAEDEFLVNPFGLLYHEVQASTLVKVNYEGNVLDSGSTALGVNKAGWSLHSAVHSTRGDINCAAHVHLPDVVAVSCIRSGLLPVSPEAVELIPNVRYHDYAGITTDKTEIDLIRSDLSNAKVLFLRNKGVIVAASAIPEVWYFMKRVISACQTQMRLLQLGCGTSLLSEFVFNSVKGDADDTAERASKQPSDFYEAIDQNPVPFASESNVCSNGESINGVGAKSTSSGVTDLSSWSVGEMEFEAQMRMLDSAGYQTGYVYRNPNLLRRLPSDVPWASGTARYQANNLFSGFVSDSTVPDASDIDDVTAATEAGAVQISGIANTVRTNKEKSVQRNQWLSKTENGHMFASQIPKHSQSTPMNGPAGKRVNELSTTRAIPPLDLSLSASSTLDKATPLRKSGHSSKKSSSFSSHNRWRKDHEKAELRAERSRTPPTPRFDLASKSASLPAHARNLVNFSARNFNTLDPADDPAFDDEELKSKAEKKKKWGSFRFPTFKKKSKQTPE